MKTRIALLLALFAASASAQQTLMRTQKPPLHGSHWMCTGVGAHDGRRRRLGVARRGHDKQKATRESERAAAADETHRSR